MGFQARLEDGRVIAPAVEVLRSRLTPDQANEKYRGVQGVCPQCQALRDSQRGTDNLSIQAALSVADLTVSFRSAVIQDGEMVRIPHFAHRPGFLQSGLASPLCRSADLSWHAAAVQVIGEWAREQWPGCNVEAEITVVADGTPPRQFRPDISIHDSAGRPVACIEYQRSYETFDRFKERHELRLTQFPQVIWFFSRGIYGRALNHRSYLARTRQRFYVCWQDKETNGLRRDIGRAPAPVTPHQADHHAAACSEASLIRNWERPADATVRRGRSDIDTSMPLAWRDEVVLPRFKRERPPAAVPGFTVAKGDRVDLWHCSYGQWVKNYVVEADPDEAGLAKIRRLDSKAHQHVRLRHLRRATA